MTVEKAIAAGYSHAATAGGDVPLKRLMHRADLQFEPDREILAAAWTELAAVDNRHMGRGIYPLK